MENKDKGKATIKGEDEEVDYYGGYSFSKKGKDNKIVEILTQDEPKLPNSDQSLFDFLFGGHIYELETSAEYPAMIHFVSNNSGALSVFYNPHFNEFYVAPRLVSKAYKLTLDKKVEEIDIPEFAKEDKEKFELWKDRYKTILEAKDKPAK